MIMIILIQQLCALYSSVLYSKDIILLSLNNYAIDPN